MKGKISAVHLFLHLVNVGFGACFRPQGCGRECLPSGRRGADRHTARLVVRAIKRKPGGRTQDVARRCAKARLKAGAQQCPEEVALESGTVGGRVFSAERGTQGVTGAGTGCACSRNNKGRGGRRG